MSNNQKLPAISEKSLRFVLLDVLYHKKAQFYLAKNAHKTQQ